MKHPISILCLADIHYDTKGDMRVVDTLYSEFVKYIDYNKNRIKWQPDYIVIAGDVADKNGGYNKVHEFIEKIRSENAFNIASDHVIIVPGNHDKNSDVPIEQHYKDKKTFDNYCGKYKPENVSEFCSVFGERFKEFITFSKKYTSDLQFHGKGKDAILDEKLSCLSGVKVFEEDHLCFLYVNTEWLYVSGRDKAIVKKSKDETDISKFVRLDEACQLCAPLIKDACLFIKNNYPTYTVITVMHRGFNHFSFEENNPTNAASIDSIGYLLKTSDIIISGHDHVFTPAPPTLIRNRIQHFQLGAVGRKEPKTMEFSRSAEIIRLDIPNEKVEQLFIEYKNTDIGFKWCFEESRRDYPLYSKFIHTTELAKTLRYYNDTLLRAKTSNEADIKKAISTYFNMLSSCRLIIIAADLEVKRNIESLVVDCEKTPVYIVVYYHYIEYLKSEDVRNTRVVSIKQQIDQFKCEHIKEIMLSQITINEVVVEYPFEDD